MRTFTEAVPEVGDTIPQDSILYFLGGKVVNGRIVVTQKDRDYCYQADDHCELVSVVIKETARQYGAINVEIDANNVVTNTHRQALINKTETSCIRTPGMMQKSGSPIMGMYTFDKNEVTTVIRAMRQELFNDINQLAEKVTEIENIIENS